jgi:hypothetical protein
MGVQMENVFGGELRLTVEETHSVLTGSLAAAVAIVVFAIAMVL